MPRGLPGKEDRDSVRKEAGLVATVTFPMTATRESLMNWQDKVREFHTKMGQPLTYKPQGLTYTRFQQRYGWLEEEVDELLMAQPVEDPPLWEDDLVAQADALADIIYVALGTASEMGLPMDKIFDAVHKANMTKEPVKDGKGKVSKPVGWVGPEEEIRKIIREAQRE